MALRPILKSKVDELFARWLSDPDTQISLKENLRQLVHGEPITQSHVSGASPRVSGKQSPRLRPTSPPFSPNASKLPSPRSPRRPLSNKNNHKTQNGSPKTNVSNNAKEVKKDIIAKEFVSDASSTSYKGRDKENKELSPSLVTASPTITTLPSSKESTSKVKRKEAKIKHVNSINNAKIPKFYFPFGKPVTNEENDKLLQKALQEISKLEGGKAFKQHMGSIIKACNLPLYWKALFFHACGGDKQGYITQQNFVAVWKRVFQSCHDEAAQFVKLAAKQGCNYLLEDDFLPLVQDIVDTHPGLTFLQEAPEFHSRYVNTVIARIFYCVNRSWSGKISISELRKSNFLQTVSLLEHEDDINQINDYFSYEHFYVIYCKFWELDKDHDLFISKEDLARHADHAISSRVIDRIFSGCVTKGKTFKEGRMSYPEFVWFLLSEEDKKHPTSIEYWFRCMDLDGDGVVSMYEMEYFYEEQVQKMESIGIEKLPFEDCLCQMLDLVRPKVQEQITLSDLKNCKMTNIFFDTFFNLDKFLDHEQRDPFANARDLENGGPELSDWEKYAAEEYEILVAEEGANDRDEIHYEDDFEPDDEELVKEELKQIQNQRVDSLRINPSKSADDDIYDFSTDKLGY